MAILQTTGGKDDLNIVFMTECWTPLYANKHELHNKT